MDLHTTEIYNTGDLLALPNRTTIHGNDGAIYVLMKESFQYGPHLLLISAGGVTSRTPLAELENNHQDFTPGQFTAVIIN